MKITVQSKSNPTKKYIVDTLSLTCSCPDFQYRRQRRGEWCKHLKEEIPKLGDKLDEAIKFVETNNDVFSFIEKFGEEMLEYLKLKGDIIETRSILKIIK